MLMDYLKKSYALIRYYFKHVRYNTYEIVSIDKCELPGDYVVIFTHLANMKMFFKKHCRFIYKPKNAR